MTWGIDIVASPIGATEDVSQRACSVIAAADFVLCEDTRKTGLLLQKLQLHSRLKSYHDHTEGTDASRWLREIMAKKLRVALMSDAGTPCIADPGYHLIRGAHAEGIPVRIVPGPSALISAAAVSGLRTEPLLFLGFFPRTDREILIQRCLQQTPVTVAFYESPRRLQDTIRLWREASPQSWVCLARELTKTHEEILVTKLIDFPEKEWLGECVVLIELDRVDRESWQDVAANLRDKGYGFKDILVALQGLVRRAELYDFLENQKESR